MKNNNYDNLIIAGCSILFYCIAMPILDSVGSFIQSAFNKKIHKWQLQMHLDEAEANAASEIIQPNFANTNAVGFTVPITEEEECDCGNRKRNK